MTIFISIGAMAEKTGAIFGRLSQVQLSLFNMSNKCHIPKVLGIQCKYLCLHGTELFCLNLQY